MIDIQPATLEDAEALAKCLRKADLDELKAALGDTPEGALTECVAFSPVSWTWRERGEIVAMFGVAGHPMRPDVGIPWMLCSDLVYQNKTRLLRHCRRYLDEMLARYPVIENCVDCRNTLSIQWLSWIGFAFAELIPFYGAQRLPFIRFVAARSL